MATIDEDTLWRALVARNAENTGAIVYSVASSGIYCRIGCPSRPPLRRNTRFHASAAHARQAGFRPCKRCKPDGPAPF
ncbi:hypothetical protein KYK29_12980 [Shinella daejeonensis]|uniref:Ada metal-binding domain-containing protein n=1 Tax=Shinella daejeonensis TaxID=659017 RepID=UPI0020C75603|nr:Ada metal-binding domain-containing protein [Shinella daejeonensis]MCP8895838.1 hypothetical protein [Shinella daejeonensis]